VGVPLEHLDARGAAIVGCEDGRTP